MPCPAPCAPVAAPCCDDGGRRGLFRHKKRGNDCCPAPVSYAAPCAAPCATPYPPGPGGPVVMPQPVPTPMDPKKGDVKKD
jgi:hypothetical protein